MDSIEVILNYLTEHWHLLQSDRFAAMVRCTYRIESPARHDFEYLLVGQMTEGDFETASLGSIIQQWWRIDDTGCRTHTLTRLPDEDESSRFWKHPMAKFLLSDRKVLLGETLGDGILCRKQTLIVEGEGGKLSLADPFVCWASTWQGIEANARELRHIGQR
jgi:hypothetical protein